MLRFLASSSRAKKALSLILKDLVTVFSGIFGQTLEPKSSNIFFMFGIIDKEVVQKTSPKQKT
jgi:hypothetical protein